MSVGHVERNSFVVFSAASLVWIVSWFAPAEKLQTSLSLAGDLLRRRVQRKGSEGDKTHDAVDATIHGEESENAADKPAKVRAPASTEERMAGGDV